MSEEMVLYVLISSVLFLAAALAHVVRLVKRWRVEVGPFSVPMSASWAGLIVTTVLALWGFMMAL